MDCLIILVMVHKLIATLMFIGFIYMCYLWIKQIVEYYDNRR